KLLLIIRMPISASLAAALRPNRRESYEMNLDNRYFSGLPRLFGQVGTKAWLTLHANKLCCNIEIMGLGFSSGGRPVRSGRPFRSLPRWHELGCGRDLDGAERTGM